MFFVSVLDAKKSMNISIFLKQFKRPVQSIIDDIRSGAGASYGAEKLTELHKMLPDKEEVKKFQQFDGNRERLCESDLFMLLLLELPSYTERVECMILKEEFGPRLETLSLGVQTMTEAARELMDCDELHIVIRLVLKAGNYMNAGGYSGNAVGFRISSLLKLVETKANQPGMNLMHFVVMEAEKNDKKLMDFPSKLRNIGAASRLFKQELEGEFERLKRKLHLVKGDMEKLLDIRDQMEGFIQEAEGELEKVQRSVLELQAVSQQLAEYFCEEEEKFKLEECCNIFKTFGEKFITATEENQHRAVLEIKRQEREREEKKAKRISIATCSHKEKDLRGIDLELLLLKNSKNSLRQRSLRRDKASIPRSQSLKQFEGAERNSAQTSSPTQEDVRHLREVSQRLLSFQAGQPSSQQHLRQMLFAQHSRISEESNESMRGSSEPAGGGNAETDGHEQRGSPTSETEVAKPERSDSPTKPTLENRQKKVSRWHTITALPHEPLKGTVSPAETCIPTEPSQATENRASGSQAHLPEDSPPDLEKQNNGLLANVPQKSHPKAVRRPWSHSEENSGPPARLFSRSFSGDRPPNAQRKRPLTRGLSDRTPSPAVSRKPPISLKPLRPAAVSKAPKEEARVEEAYAWKFSNLFSKKSTKASGGESAAKEKVAKEIPGTSSQSTNPLTNFLKLFSDNKTAKHKNS
ncbi:FH2 domain-containing protein 1-like isoform X2 [Carcharodon carcharias]|uniref:FH2 domain-containing protein 1-like isoform X2 n=1 Tax=Carcharodon carcharias TaxID=13397 RepID=UPI001B7DF3CF|nr:FH2 domain-containing protein 1-like isoform X2 [Carcharodon carcharias]